MVDELYDRDYSCTLLALSKLRNERFYKSLSGFEDICACLDSLDFVVLEGSACAHPDSLVITNVI